MVEDVDGEHWKQGIWVRKRPGLIRRVTVGWTRVGRLFRKDREELDGNDPDVLVVDERRPLLG